MAKRREPVLLSWSGGKDSALTLYELQRSSDFEVVGLLTAIDEDEALVTLHGVGRDLLEDQAEALQLPLTFVTVPKKCCNRTYNDRMNAALTPYRERGVHRVAFGDLYLDDIRDFREECLERVGMKAVFPLWQRDTKELSWAFLNLRFKAVVTCIETRSLPEDFAGRPYDKAFLGDLPLSVDPCGENGEFHTFVYDGPFFARRLPISVGRRYGLDGFHFCEVTTKANAAQPGLARAK